jgi:hypothetical protein
MSGSAANRDATSSDASSKQESKNPRSVPVPHQVSSRSSNKDSSSPIALSDRPHRANKSASGILGLRRTRPAFSSRLITVSRSSLFDFRAVSATSGDPASVISTVSPARAAAMRSSRCSFASSTLAILMPRILSREQARNAVRNDCGRVPEPDQPSRRSPRSTSSTPEDAEPAGKGSNFRGGLVPTAITTLAVLRSVIFEVAASLCDWRPLGHGIATFCDLHHLAGGFTARGALPSGGRCPRGGRR